jgi:hypothetical protein
MDSYAVSPPKPSLLTACSANGNARCHLHGKKRASK